jgi:hypothetical protein
VRLDFTLPAAARVGVGVLGSKRTHLLDDFLESVPGTAVIVPVPRWGPVYRSSAAHNAFDSMNCQIEMAAEPLVHRRVAIRRATAEVRCLQVHIDHVAQAAPLNQWLELLFV